MDDRLFTTLPQMSWSLFCQPLNPTSGSNEEIGQLTAHGLESRTHGQRIGLRWSTPCSMQVSHCGILYRFQENALRFGVCAVGHRTLRRGL
jgi:hypothetical protein